MEQTYPFYIFVYFNERRFLVNVFLETNNGYMSNSPWIRIVERNSNTDEVIKVISDAVDFIEKSPLLIMNSEERWERSYNYWTFEDDYNTIEEFTKANNSIMINKYEDGRFGICAMKKYSRYRGYNGYLAPKQYVDDIFSDDFYRLFNECISLAEERYKKRLPARKYEKEELTLYSGDVISFYPPKDMQFEDMQSGHDACMYRVFEYCTKSSSEPCAAFYLGTGDDLNSDLSKENICKTWTNARGAYDNFNYETVVHGIFTIKAEIYNDKTHAVSYFAYLPNADVLECTMEVNEPQKRKKTDAKLSRLFEDFSGNIVFSDK